ncbi:MAG TPA: STAS domain-containing protein [Candidatus Sulfotelmatobacter sp.]|nr:STAS domain-containing protein [Candidatus Sulfotelmatobacter sp.]
MGSGDLLRCEIEDTKDDQFGNKVRVVKCHGKLVTETTNKLRETVKPLLPEGGRIVIDLGDVEHLDSSGLGALVSLKASAVKQGLCILEFANITPRILQLFRITKLQEMLSS